MPKVVENDVTEEFTVEHGKRSLVANAFERIRLLFQVLVAFSSPEASASKTGFQWLALKGEKEKTTKAKEYIKSLCNPEMEITVPFVESFYAVIYGSRDELERTTRAVVNFPSRKECSVQGNAEAVIMVKSAIEDKLHHMNSLPSQQDIDPSLREFALKLGYSKQVIDQAVRKLGSDATQNTLLSELLNTKASQPHQTCATSTQPVVPAHTSLYLRRENRDVVARGASNGHPFTRGTGFENSGELYMERGASQHNVSLRKDNRDISGHGHAMRAGLERPADILVRGPPMMKPSMVPVGYEGSSDVLERGVMRGTKRGYERSGDMARSLIPGASHGIHDMHQFPGSSVVNERILPDRQEEHFVYQQIKSVQETVTDRSSDLRPVVIDGSNVAMSHGLQEYFSCKGIQLCVDWFKKKGHKEITVFVPLWRKEASRPDRKITDQDILYNLERERVLVFTPSRKINGRRIVCYDDRFIIKLAVETDGIVVSNDNFRDLTKEGPKWKDTIEQRLLMYSFVGDMFMVPDDPLGKHGPTLDEFLRKGSPTHPKICPYLKKCTYGLKCRFYHPERDQDRKLQELRSIFSESVPDAVMIRVLNDNPAADVSLLANQLCDLGYGLGKQ